MSKTDLLGVPQLKRNTYMEVLSCFGCGNNTGVILLFFQDRPMFSHINGKLSPRPFEFGLGLS